MEWDRRALRRFFLKNRGLCGGRLFRGDRRHQFAGVHQVFGIQRLFQAAHDIPARAVFCALLISEVSAIILTFNHGRQAAAELMGRANRYMSDNNMPIELRDKVRQYLELEYNEKNLMYDEAELLDMLPASLVEDIMTFK